MSDTATLLLLEDDPLIRTFLADNLTADGYEVLVASTLEDAMRELEFKRPDLAIVDLKLPDGSGLELVRRVRAADGVGRLDPELPLLMLSASGTELDRIRGFERGLTTTWSSRSRTRNCGCGSRRCSVVRRCVCSADCCAWGSWRSIRPGG